MGRKRSNNNQSWLGFVIRLSVFGLLLVTIAQQIKTLRSNTEAQGGWSVAICPEHLCNPLKKAAKKVETEVIKRDPRGKDAVEAAAFLADPSRKLTEPVVKETASGSAESPDAGTQIEGGVTEEQVTLGNPVALQGMPLDAWRTIEKMNGPKARKRLEKGAEGGKKSKNVFDSVDVALPLYMPILSYPLGSGAGQGQKNVVGLKKLAKSAKEQGRPCVIYGMGIADDSGFEQQMAATGCETHAFDCTVDDLDAAVYKKKFKFHKWCIGEGPADTQSQGENTYVHHTVNIDGKLPCDDNCDVDVKVISRAGGGHPADFYLAGKKIAFTTSRGMNVVTVDPVTKDVVSTTTYDLYENADKENNRLTTFLNELPDGRIVLMAIMDTGLDLLRRGTLEAMHDVGSKINGGNFRECYAFVGRKGSPAKAETRSRNVKMVFKTLSQTMQELGHTHIDLLKFDIEGFEWFLFESEFFKKKREQLPDQIAFELHTAAASPAYVPQEVVKGRGSKQVSQLFLTLYELGYRVTSKEINNGDPACAEFVALNVQ